MNSTQLIDFYNRRKSALGEKATKLNMFLEGYGAALNDIDIDNLKALKALKVFCRCECDAKILDCPHKEQGGCAKYKKFKSIFYGKIHNLRTATEQE